MPDVPQSPLERLRAICLALPEATERLSHGEPTWFVRGKTTFVTYADHHHDDGVLDEVLDVGPVDGLPGHVQPHPEPPAAADVGRHEEPRLIRGDPLVLRTLGCRAPKGQPYRTVAPRRLVAALDAAGR